MGDILARSSCCLSCSSNQWNVAPHSLWSRFYAYGRSADITMPSVHPSRIGAQRSQAGFGFESPLLHHRTRTLLSGHHVGESLEIERPALIGVDALAN